MTSQERQRLYHERWRAKLLGIEPPPLPPDGRGQHGRQPRGVAHHRWNKSRIISDEGYAKVRVGVTHPLADPNGYAYEHVLVAVAALGRRLRDDEHVHHRNEVKTDNRWENLRLLTPSEHARLHGVERGGLNGPRPGQGEFPEGGN